MSRAFYLGSVMIALAGLCVRPALAQGTFIFRVPMNGIQMVPAVDTPAFGGGRLELNGNTLSYNVGLRVEWFDPTGAFIHGPGAPGSNGPLIRDLGRRGVTPGPDATLAFAWVNNFTVTQTQVEELLSGLWYVRVTSIAHPEGEIRGQIILVPEASTLGLLALGGGVLSALTWRRHASKQAMS